MISVKRFLSATSFSLLLVSICTALLMLAGLVSVSMIVNAHFYIYVLLLTADFLLCKRFSLFQVWIASFIFIILSEMILLANEESSISLSSYIPAISFLLIANDMVLLSYRLYTPSHKINTTYLYVVKKQKVLYYLIVFLTVFYISTNISSVISSMTTLASEKEAGSAMGSFNASSTLSDGLGILLPALIAYYYKFCSKKSAWISLFYLLPIMFILFMSGIRNRLLFAIMPFFVIMGIANFGKTDLRKSVQGILLILFLGLLSILMKSFRTSAVEVITTGSYSIGFTEKEAPLLVNMARNMSNEGVVYMTKVSDDYFADHPHHYGKETAFIMYFWVPRSIWPDKPTQLDYWLVREVDNHSDGYSSASGFSGELKADFGWLSLFFIIFIGLYLRKADNFVYNTFKCGGQNFARIIAAACVPYIFFFVRSPLTSSYTLIFEIILYVLLRNYLCKRVRLCDEDVK